MKSIEKRWVIAVFLIFLLTQTDNLYGQEQFQRSQYENIAFVINPALTGVDDEVKFVGGYRSQWSAFEYAPVNYYGGFSGTISSLKKKFSGGRTIRLSQSQVYGKPLNKVGEWNHGVGLYLSGDHAGPFHQYSAYFNYAFIYSISQEYKIGFGVSADINFQQFHDKNVAVYSADLDQVYQDYINQNRNRIEGNLNVGVSLVGHNLFLAYSIHHLTSNSNLETVVADIDPGLYHYLIGGYNFLFSDQLTFQPSLLMGYNKYNSFTLDIQTRLKYRELLWGGLGYRHDNAAVFLLGFTIGNSLSFGYSYDYQFNEIGPYTKGTHEITLCYALYKEGKWGSVIW